MRSYWPPVRIRQPLEVELALSSSHSNSHLHSHLGSHARTLELKLELELKLKLKLKLAHLFHWSANTHSEAHKHASAATQQHSPPLLVHLQARQATREQHQAARESPQLGPEVKQEAQARGRGSGPDRTRGTEAEWGAQD